MNPSNPLKKIKSFCSNCKNITNHEILYEDKYVEEPNDAIWSGTIHQVIKCMGCENRSFRLVEANSEDLDQHSGEILETVTIYPFEDFVHPPIASTHFLPIKVRDIYFELLKALTNGAPILTAIGLRALIEAICLDCKTTSKNLEGKIKELATKGFLSKKQAEFLHKHRFIGNEAAHEIQAPKKSELLAALEIAETILKTMYILPIIHDTIPIKSKKNKSNQ